MILLLQLDPLLNEVAKTYRLESHLAAVRRVLSRRSRMEPGHVFRAHWKNVDDIIEQPEIKFRVHLDQLLGAVSALHIGGFKSLLTKNIFSGDILDLGDVLDHPVIRNYYEDYYPYGSPILARESWKEAVPARYSEQRAFEQNKTEWETHYRSFLHLDAKFTARSKMSDFLDLLDDYEVNGIWLEDLREALTKPKKLSHFLGRRESMQLFEGLDAFLMFSRELDVYLSKLDGYPILKGHVWLHFAYWYGNGGNNMREVIEWLWGAIEDQTNNKGEADRFSKLASSNRSCIGRLSDPLHYPKNLLQLAGSSLADWARSAGLMEGRPELRQLMAPLS